MKKNLAMILCAVCTAPLLAEPGIQLSDRDTIVFWGDSITDFGWYVPYVQLGLALKFREKHVSAINAGVGGDTTGRAMIRLDFDVFRFEPQYVVSALGENDLGRNLYTTPDPIPSKERCLEQACRNLANAITRIRDAGAEAIVLAPTAFDQYSDLKATNYPYYNTYGKAKLSSELHRLAQEKETPFIDVFSPMTAIINHDPDSHICGNDRIHPSRTGHLVIALEIVKAFGALERNASVRLIDGKTVAVHASVTDLQLDGATLSFGYRPETLPFPVDTSYTELAAISSLPSEMNRETIVVMGLPEGEYELSVDDTKLAVVATEELTVGVNIAAMDTPNQRKAQALLPLMEAFHRDTVPLRKIAASKMIAIMRKADLNDLASVDRTLDEWLEECRTSPAFEGRKQSVEIYRKYRTQLPELEKKLADLTDQIYAQAEPTTCRIRIAPVE